jgi:hypothetical protein
VTGFLLAVDFGELRGEQSVRKAADFGACAVVDPQSLSAVAHINACREPRENGQR